MEVDTKESCTASEQEDCPICYDSFIDQESDEETGKYRNPKGRLGVQGCGHDFCRECLTNHCKHAISARDIPIPCPASASNQCENVLQESQIQELLCGPDVTLYGSISDETSDNHGYTDWIRFQRYQKMLQDPSLISCSCCVELLSKEDNQTFGGAENQLTCPSCGHLFCSVHGDAHPGKTCEEYKPARQIRKSEKAIRKFTKPCSHCGIPIEKESGCDHIICTSCKDDMCFRCGTHLYLSGDMIRSCKKCEQNYIDHRHIWAYRLTLCLSLPIYIPICVMHILVMGAMALATCGCFCCLGCGVQVDKGETSFEPFKAIRTVLAMVFLPAVDLSRQCGIPCCCGLDVPGIEASNTSTTVLDNDDSDDDAETENEV
jgi:hypothetical protein